MQGECKKCGEVSPGFFCNKCGEPLFADEVYSAPPPAPAPPEPPAADRLEGAASPAASPVTPQPEVYDGAYVPSGEPYPDDEGWEMSRPRHAAPAEPMPPTPPSGPPMAQTPPPIPLFGGETSGAAYNSPAEPSAWPPPPMGAMPMGRTPGQPVMGYGPPPGSLPGSSGGPEAVGSSGANRFRKVLPIAVLVIILVAGGIFTFMRISAAPLKINVPAPDGWSVIPASEYKGFNQQFEDIAEMDVAYSDTMRTGIIAVMHGHFLPKLPETKDLAELQKFVDENGAKLKSEFFYDGFESQDIETSSIGELAYEPVLLDCGYAALYCSGTMTLAPSQKVLAETLFLYRGNTGYAVWLYRPLGTDTTEDIEFLRQNITFGDK